MKEGLLASLAFLYELLIYQITPTNFNHNQNNPLPPGGGDERGEVKKRGLSLVSLGFFLFEVLHKSKALLRRISRSKSHYIVTHLCASREGLGVST